jgi:DNA-directed RNA polymerase subunit RPC12/RpoP
MAQKQYKCQACGATFNNEAELDRHNRTAHSQYRCEACGQTFKSEAELEAHNRSMHPERQRTPTR